MNSELQKKVDQEEMAEFKIEFMRNNINSQTNSLSPKMASAMKSSRVQSYRENEKISKLEEIIRELQE